MKKKIWGIVFILCLFVCLLPPTATATEGNVAKVGSTEYATIDDAIAAWTNGTTLTLLSDVTLSDVINLSSTEYHILDLGTYTMTAASGKDAIQYVVKGRSSAGYALDIKADATNPGGITATGGSIVRHTKPRTNAPSKDRPITRFYGGVFNASYVVRQGGSFGAGYTGSNAPHFYFYGGEFNGTIYTNRSQNQFHGGTFNGSMQMSVDTSSYTLVAGGIFKNLSNSMNSTLNDDKFMIASHKCSTNCGCGVSQIYDKEVYVDDNGYYIVAAADPSEGFEASIAKNPGTNDYLAYSKVGTEGALNYTDVYTALEKNPTATITVYVDELDLTNSSFQGTLVLPDENSTLTVTFPAGTEPTLQVKASSDDLIPVYEESSEAGSGTYVLMDASIVNLITGAKNEAISAAEARLNTAKAELQAAIDAKADAATVNTAIAGLQSAIDALNAVKDDYADADATLKSALEGKITAANETLSAAIAALEKNLEDTTSALKEKIDTKADANEVSASVAKLKEAITALQDATTKADIGSKAELEATITAANETLGAAIAALEKNLEDTTSTLEEKIDAKADGAAVNAAIGELQKAIDALEAVKDDYADADATLRTELEGKISEAKSAAISAAEALLNSAKAELQAKIDSKADAATVNTAIAKLQNAIAVLEKARDNYITADATLKAELEAAIAKAKQEAIEAAKGHIPHIGENGNWWIGQTDTEVSAAGIPGTPGKDGVTPQLRINSENIWEVSYDGGKTWESMGISAVGTSGTNGQNGADGRDGADGVGIVSIEKTDSNGNVDIYTITLTNSKTFPFTVTNGVDGKDGTDGKDAERTAIMVPTVIGSAALVSNIGLLVWILTKKKSLV